MKMWNNNKSKLCFGGFIAFIFIVSIVININSYNIHNTTNIYNCNQTNTNCSCPTCPSYPVCSVCPVINYDITPPSLKYLNLYDEINDCYLTPVGWCKTDNYLYCSIMLTCSRQIKTNITISKRFYNIYDISFNAEWISQITDPNCQPSWFPYGPPNLGYIEKLGDRYYMIITNNFYRVFGTDIVFNADIDIYESYKVSFYNSPCMFYTNNKLYNNENYATTGSLTKYLLI